LKERTVVSVLFCDLVGFTAASESADPEEVQARIAPCHARTRERIEAYGGTVAKFIGDAVVAVFGVETQLPPIVTVRTSRRVSGSTPPTPVHGSVAVVPAGWRDGYEEVRLGVRQGRVTIPARAG
jgi:class 3 adenylate cyclase